MTLLCAERRASGRTTQLQKGRSASDSSTNGIFEHADATTITKCEPKQRHEGLESIPACLVASRTRFIPSSLNTRQLSVPLISPYHTSIFSSLVFLPRRISPIFSPHPTCPSSPRLPSLPTSPSLRPHPTSQSFPPQHPKSATKAPMQTLLSPVPKTMHPQDPRNPACSPSTIHVPSPSLSPSIPHTRSHTMPPTLRQP